LDDIFDRALDDTENSKSEKFKINRTELRNKIKGGQNFVKRQNLSEKKRTIENNRLENNESALLKFNSNPNLNYYACKVNVINTRSVENLSNNIKGGNEIRNGLNAKNKVISIIDPAKIALLQTVYTKLVTYFLKFFSQNMCCVKL
jgi:hypothetical protein